MQSKVFSTPNGDATLSYHPGLLDDVSDSNINILWNAKPKEYDKIKIGNKVYSEHRCNSLFTIENNIVFPYSGKIVKSSGKIDDYDILINCLNISNDMYPDFNFNAAFVNWYVDGSEYVGAHSDDIRKLKDGSPIISFTFLLDDKVPRKFTVNSYEDNTIIDSYILGHGDLLVMEDGFQKCLKHAIPKCSIKKNFSRRINVTIRAFV